MTTKICCLCNIAQKYVNAPFFNVCGIFLRPSASEQVLCKKLVQHVTEVSAVPTATIVCYRLQVALIAFLPLRQYQPIESGSAFYVIRSLVAWEQSVSARW